MKGILGRKIGMTQVFTTDGLLIPVTVVEADANVVLQKKTVATDGYDAIQVGFEDKREKLANKAELGIVKKANTAPKRFIKEFKSFTSEPSWLYTLTVSILNPPSLNYSAVSTGVSVATSASLVSSTTGVKSTNS